MVFCLVVRKQKKFFITSISN